MRDEKAEPDPAPPGDEASPDTRVVRGVIVDGMEVHPRLSDQGMAPDDDARRHIAEQIPDLLAFGDSAFSHARVILDWDHRIPTQAMVLRVLASYNEDARDRLDEELETRRKKISDDNLYPEFDLPDFVGLEGSESYAAVIEPGTFALQEFQLTSEWRKYVDTEPANEALRLVQKTTSFKRAMNARTREGLGGPVVMGWSPPCTHPGDRWIVEVWVLIDFDGHTGTARVFMVDVVDSRITREFDTQVRVS